jgi:hypothetical protein
VRIMMMAAADTVLNVILHPSLLTRAALQCCAIRLRAQQCVRDLRVLKAIHCCGPQPSLCVRPCTYLSSAIHCRLSGCYVCNQRSSAASLNQLLCYQMSCSPAY